MSPETALALNAVNLRFYRTRAAAFSATREAPWPGFARVLAHLPAAAGPLLDVGCGNGRFGAALAAAHPLAGPWIGVDASPTQLAACRVRRDLPRRRALLVLDVVAHPDALPCGPFDAVFAFGLLHHVPGEARRATLLSELAERVAPGGLLAATFWRFGAFARFEKLTVPWESWEAREGAGPAPCDLEPGDRLLSFGGVADEPRYCHFADDDEIARLIAAPGLPLADRFHADGREGELNAYVTWERPL